MFLCKWDYHGVILQEIYLLVYGTLWWRYLVFGDASVSQHLPPISRLRLGLNRGSNSVRTLRTVIRFPVVHLCTGATGLNLSLRHFRIGSSQSVILRSTAWKVDEFANPLEADRYNHLSMSGVSLVTCLKPYICLAALVAVRCASTIAQFRHSWFYRDRQHQKHSRMRMCSRRWQPLDMVSGIAFARTPLI